MRGLTPRASCSDPEEKLRLLRCLARGPFYTVLRERWEEACPLERGSRPPGPQPITAAWPGPQFGSWNGEGEEEGRAGKGVHATSPPFVALHPQPPSPAPEPRGLPLGQPGSC